MAGGKVRKLNTSPEAISFGVHCCSQWSGQGFVCGNLFKERGRVSVMGNGGAFFRDIYITNEVLANIEFPEKENEQGSAVVKRATRMTVFLL